MEILNKVADIVERLNPIEKEQLLNWCEKYQAGMTDLVEVGNAAIQIREEKQVYLEGITTEEELGEYLLKENGMIDLLENVRNKIREALDLDGDYLNCEDIGRDYDINNETGYFMTDLSGRRIKGYIDKNEINEFEYKREEFLQLDLDKVMGEEVPFQQNIDDLEEKAMKACMERTKEKSPEKVEGLEKER